VLALLLVPHRRPRAQEARLLRRAAAPTKCNHGERESIFTSPLSSQCKLSLRLPLLLEFILVMHSVMGEPFLCLHTSVGVSLRG
jgi:hypothetical protein